MRKLFLIAVSVILALSVLANSARAINPFGETGFFLTPHAEVPAKGSITFGYRFLDYPVAGGDLHGGSLVFGISNSLEVGYGLISYGDSDRHTVGAKYRLLYNEKTGFTVAAGVQTFLRNGPNMPSEDWHVQGYLTAAFPYPYGIFRIGGIVTKDNKDENKPGFMGAVDYMFYPDIILFYEYTSLSRISGTGAHSAGVRWIPSDRIPILLDFGAVNSEFVSGQGSETVLTAGVTFGYHEKYVEERFWPTLEK
ncbi:MAG: hypothetical protein V2G42_03980 [bacterium JZ-2024 1]